MNDDSQNSKLNTNNSSARPRGRYMDMAAPGRRKMSPEMLAAQERLKHKQQDSRPPRPRLTPQQGPMTAVRPQRAQHTAYAKTTVRTAPSAPQAHLPRSDRGSQVELETLEFEAIDSLAMDTTEELANSFVEEPKPLSEARKPKTAHKEETPEEKGPDNNKFSLGGKSPFINTLNLDKRPLSGHSVTKPVVPAPSPSPRLTTSDTIPTVVASKKKSRRSNIALGIAIVLTVILGAIVGTFVYLAFFQ